MVKRSSVEERAQAATASANEEQKPEIVGEFLTEVSRLITSGDSTVVCYVNCFYQETFSSIIRIYCTLILKGTVTKSTLNLQLCQ